MSSGTKYIKCICAYYFTVMQAYVSDVYVCVYDN